LDQFIVIGVYQFIGFHLAKDLLDRGEVVNGCDWECDEDKDLEIGRNANFSFIQPAELTASSVTDQTTIYISWYDLQRRNRASYEWLVDVLSKWAKLEKQPNVLIFQSLAAGEQDQFPFGKTLYLPTIYGPWQHESMVFEAKIRNKPSADIQFALEKEYKLDAIYISDLIGSLEKVWTMSEQKVGIKSKKNNQWIQCAERLFQPNDSRLLEWKAPPESKIEAEIYVVKNQVSPQVGIAKQQEHYERMQRIK
jgi:nucleoside-diphosphate-sugar epimerase